MRVRVELGKAVLIQTFNGLRVVDGAQQGRFELMQSPNLFVEEIRHFVDALERGEQPSITADDNTRAQRTIDALLARAKAAL